MEFHKYNFSDSFAGPAAFCEKSLFNTNLFTKGFFNKIAKGTVHKTAVK